MKTLGQIVIIILIVLSVFLLIVGVPIAFGKLFLGWSNRRIKYIFSNSVSSVMSSVVISLILTGLILLVGLVFKQQWAFSGGLLLVYLLWVSIKSIVGFIRNSRGM